MKQFVKWVDGVPVCQIRHDSCDDCSGIAVGDRDDVEFVCMGAVRDDRALLVAISEAVYGPDYSEAYDEPRALAGLVDAVRAGWAEKERLRGVAELYKRSDDLVTAGCHCDGGCGGHHG